MVREVMVREVMIEGGDDRGMVMVREMMVRG